MYLKVLRFISVGDMKAESNTYCTRQGQRSSSPLGAVATQTIDVFIGGYYL